MWQFDFGCAVSVYFHCFCAVFTWGSVTLILRFAVAVVLFVFGVLFLCLWFGVALSFDCCLTELCVLKVVGFPTVVLGVLR